MHDRWTACNVISAQGYNNKSSYLSILFNVFVPDSDRAAPAPVPFACKRWYLLRIKRGARITGRVQYYHNDLILFEIKALCTRVCEWVYIYRSWNSTCGYVYAPKPHVMVYICVHLKVLKIIKTYILNIF